MSVTKLVNLPINKENKLKALAIVHNHMLMGTSGNQLHSMKIVIKKGYRSMEIDKGFTRLRIFGQNRPTPEVTAIVAPQKSQEAIVAMTNNMFYVINHHTMTVISSFRSKLNESI